MAPSLLLRLCKADRFDFVGGSDASAVVATNGTRPKSLRKDGVQETQKEKRGFSQPEKIRSGMSLAFHRLLPLRNSGVNWTSVPQPIATHVACVGTQRQSSNRIRLKMERSSDLPGTEAERERAKRLGRQRQEQCLSVVIMFVTLVVGMRTQTPMDMNQRIIHLASSRSVSVSLRFLVVPL